HIPNSFTSAKTIQELPHIEATTTPLFTQNKWREAGAPSMTQPGERAASPSFPAARKRRWLIAVVCVSLLVVLGAGTLFVLSHPSTSSNPYAPYKGNQALNDTLANQNPHVNWQEGSNSNQASCQFKNGAYYAFQPLLGYFHACVAQLTNYKNFAYEVEASLLQGDYTGILFRATDSIDSHYYLFRVNADGSYVLKRYIDGTDATALMLDTGSTQAYHAGYGQKNRLAVVADNDHLTLYINGQKLDTVSDDTYTQGQIGVVTGSEQRAPAEASFSNVRVWTW
ncbi:MAG TPA: family 16 glycoside hydrolase, partial [Ktedonobacteraceae bacterium]